jgi:hypothetical protein
MGKTMPKFRLTVTSRCLVTWITKIEAKDIEEASRLFDMGASTRSGPVYSDDVADISTKTKVEQIGER